jgi:hypothetical protein
MSARHFTGVWHAAAFLVFWMVVALLVATVIHWAAGLVGWNIQ